jgi:hypothetical protein
MASAIQMPTSVLLWPTTAYQDNATPMQEAVDALVSSGFPPARTCTMARPSVMTQTIVLVQSTRSRQPLLLTILQCRLVQLQLQHLNLLVQLQLQHLNLLLLLLYALQLGRQSPEVAPPVQAVAIMLDAVEAILPIGLVLLGAPVAPRPMLSAAPAANAVVTTVTQTGERRARAPKQRATLCGFCNSIHHPTPVRCFKRPSITS